MYRSALLFGALAGVLTFAPRPVAAGPLLLSPLLSQPSLVATLAPPADDLLSPPAFDYLGGPAQRTAIPFTLDAAPFDLGLGRNWSAARRADLSLHLADWRQVLNVARLGVFVIPLRDDPAECTNILLAAEAVDNTSVAPGQVFSFNRVVGERTPERGYQDGLMFSQGQVIRGTGGGICLVATGLYNAAMQAGLKLLERHPHSGVVSYAPPGCDAGIVYGVEDMQFQNTTPATLIVKAQPDLENDRVVVALYGGTPPPGRHVRLKTTHLAYIAAPTVTKQDPTLLAGSPPVVDQKSRLGYDVTVERFWTQGERIVRREVVVTEHRAPRAKIVRVPVPTAPAVPNLLPGSVPGMPFTIPGVTPPTPESYPVSPEARHPSLEGKGEGDKGLSPSDQSDQEATTPSDTTPSLGGRGGEPPARRGRTPSP